MTIRALEQGWVLETKSTAYSFGVNKAGLLVHTYWGKKLPYLEDYPQPAKSEGWASFNGAAHLTPEEYPAYAGTSYIDPCLKATFADGVRDVVLRFESAQIREGDTPELDIHLVDAYYPFKVTLHYRVYAAHDLIERWVTVSNHGDTPITLERVWSAQWHLPCGDEYYLTHVTGRWLDEMHLRREPLRHGIKTLESRRLTTSHHHNPWFALECGQTSEGIDHPTVADRMARAVGVMPLGDDKPPVQDNLPRFGLFADQALRMGISGTQAEQVVREVKSSPDGRLTDPTRAVLVEQVRAERNVSYDNAQSEVNRLEHSAQMLPNEITAFGMMAFPQTTIQPQVTVAPEITLSPQVDVSVEAPQNGSDAAYTDAMRKQSALGGSGSVVGGGS